MKEPGVSTGAQRPTAPRTGRLWVVTDAAATGTCASPGSGAVALLCVYDGSAWTSPVPNGGSGAGAGTGNAVTEYGQGLVKQSLFTLTNLAIPLTDEAGVVGYGGLKVYDFPGGAIVTLGAVTDLALTQSCQQVESTTLVAAAGCTGDGNLIVTVTGAGLTGSPLDLTVDLTTSQNTAALVAAEVRAHLNATAAITALYTVGGTDAAITLTATRTSGPDGTLNIDINADDAGTTATGITNDATSDNTTTGLAADWDGDFGIGTATAGNDAGPLAGTEQNILANVSTTQAVAGVSALDTYAASFVAVDGTATAADLYFNFLVDDADQDIDATTCSVILNGTVRLTWVNVGDF